MKDSSEIREAASLFNELISQNAMTVSSAPAAAPGRYSSGLSRNYRRSVSRSSRRGGQRKKAASQTQPAPAPVAVTDSGEIYRGDRLENMLYAMCKRGGFTGAVLVDSDGLPLAVYNSPVKDEALASAFAMTLGDTIGKAGKIIGESGMDSIAMDISYTDKACVRRFVINNLPYFLMIVCLQDIDERAEVELSIDQIISFLKKN